MMHVFIAEFYKTETDETPLYSTQLCHIEDSEAFIKSIGMEEDPLSLPGSTDYIKVVKQYELTELFPLENNPELETIILEGQECRKTVLHAYETKSDINIVCDLGVEGTIWAHFTGNKPDSRVRISHMYFPPVADLPLRCFKEKMGVLTLNEVIDKLETEYGHICIDNIDELIKQFQSGLDRAIDIVSHEFGEDLDLDGNPQLLHMTAVSAAGSNDDERLVGMLHDLVEDKDWTFDDLLEDGFPEHIVDTLRLLTHDKETPYMDYVRNICESGNKVALAVKINDLNHNLKRGRAGGHWHHVEKHEKALSYIQEFIANKESDE